MKIQLSAPGTFAVTAAPADAPPDAPERRTIAGIAVPWGAVGNALTGKVRFEAGSLPVDGPAPKLLRDHSVANPIGIVTARRSTDAGMEFEARISATAAGDEALTLAADGVLDSVSVGVDVLKHHYDGDVLVVEAGRWAELSLLPFGAFEAAKVLDVAASAPDESEPTEPTEPEEGTEMTEVAATAPLPIVTASRKPAQVTAAGYLGALVRKDSAMLEVLAAEMVTSDVYGILPEPLVGPIWETINQARNFTNSFGVNAMPTAGETFYRRKITQHVDVDEQVAQFDQLASQALVVDKLQVNKATLGGYIDMSHQSIDWADQNAVNLVINDMARMYAKASDTRAATEFIAGIPGSLPVADWEDGDELIDQIYTAAYSVQGEIDELPTTIWCSPARFLDLAKAKASNGDRIFPYLGPSNAAGTLSAASYVGNPLGLRLVVSNRLAATAIVVGHPIGFEIFEQSGGLLRVEQPDTWSTRIAIANYFATLMIGSGAFIKLVDTP